MHESTIRPFAVRQPGPRPSRGRFGRIVARVLAPVGLLAAGLGVTPSVTAGTAIEADRQALRRTPVVDVTSSPRANL